MARDYTLAELEVITADSGTVFCDKQNSGVRLLVVRGPYAMCAYLGVPSEHILAGKSYNYLDEHGPSVHGGWTFAGVGDGDTWPLGWYWFGWDYAYCNDGVMYERDGGEIEGHIWTVEEVIEEAFGALLEFIEFKKSLEN